MSEMSDRYRVVSGRGTAGGAANEAGSLHRAGMAALLAVFGLVDRAVDELDDMIPVEIELETLDATDDIVCRMRGGSSWYIQAKRTAGIDGQLRSSIRQWADQPLTSIDVVVLGARSLQGALGNLQSILDRLRSDPGTILSPSEEKKVRAFQDQLEIGAPQRVSELLSHVRLLSWKVESDADDQVQLGSALLEGTLVAPGSGLRAFRALRSFFQEAAAQRARTKLEDWIAALTHAGIEVRADGSGVAGAKAQAYGLAIREYRSVQQRSLNVLDLSMLFDGVAEIRVEDLASTFQVKRHLVNERGGHEQDFYTVVRRNDRFILTGLPGMGKSAAMRQVAARLSADPSAPVPVLLDLKTVGGHVNSREGVNLALVLSQAVQSCPGVDPDLLARALRAELSRGNIVLLVDGLDEALGRAGMIAAGLADLLSSLHSKCGFVLSTRHNALRAAQNIGLPVVDLVTPNGLRETLVIFLRALAGQSDVADKDAWLIEKTNWLERAMGEREDIWSVPLLATLMTYRAARGKAASVNAATLLNDVIKDSVEKWEHRRGAHPPGGNDKELRPKMLVDGFATVGHALNSRTELTVEVALATLVDELTQWDLPKPVTTTIAEQILWFWDEALGVFIQEDDKIRARSRQFSELADAHWAISRAGPERKRWVEDAIGSDSKRSAVEIAIATDPSMMRALFEQAETSADSKVRARALTWILSVARTEISALDENLVDSLIDLVTKAAVEGLHYDENAEDGQFMHEALAGRRKQKRELDGPGWGFAHQLASLPLPALSRSARDAGLAQLSLDPAHINVVRAITAVADADVDDRRLSVNESRRVQAVLDTPLQPTPAPIKKPGKPIVIRGSTDHVIPGVEIVLEAVAARLSEFGEDAPAKVYALARRLSVSDYTRIGAILSASGQIDSDGLRLHELISPIWRELVTDYHGLGWLLRALSAHPEEPNGQHEVDKWRWNALADLVSSLGYQNASIDGVRLASAESSANIDSWVSAVASAAGIEPTAIAERAKSLLALGTDERSIGELIVAPRLTDIAINYRLLSSQQCLDLVPCLMSGSDWMSQSAFWLLVNQDKPELVNEIRMNGNELTPRSMWRASVVLCANSDEPIVDIGEALHSAESPTRAGAGFVLKHRHDGGLGSLWRDAKHDEDLTVRSDAGADTHVDPPSYWSCRWCGTKNEVDDTSCRGCSLSSRPRKGD